MQSTTIVSYLYLFKLYLKKVVDADEDDDDNRWLEDSINGIGEADEED